jgi:hypothetical protein
MEVADGTSQGGQRESDDEKSLACPKMVGNHIRPPLKLSPAKHQPSHFLDQIVRLECTRFHCDDHVDTRPIKSNN